MPSAPRNTFERQSAQRRASYRSNESFDTYDAGSVTLAAGAVFQDIGVFGSEPDSIVLFQDGGNIEWRVIGRGRAPRPAFILSGVIQHILAVSGEIVQARDTAGAGGQRVAAIGRWASRAIDVRDNHPGPSRERPTLPVDERATQVLTAE